MRADFDEELADGSAAGIMSWAGDEPRPDVVPEPEDGGDDAGMAGILAPMREPNLWDRIAGSLVHLWDRATGPLAQLWGTHDWQPPTLSEHLGRTDRTDPFDRWVTRPAGHVLVRLYRLAHDRALARAVGIRLAITALVLTAILILLLTHKGA